MSLRKLLLGFPFSLVLIIHFAASPVFAQSGGDQALVIDERTLLKAYLGEVQKNNEAERLAVVARYELERQIFEDQKNRFWNRLQWERDSWWRTFNESERAKANAEFWGAYEQGARAARAMVNEVSSFRACERLRNFVESGELPFREEEKLQRTAFTRGLISAFPSCFSGDPLADLREQEKRISKMDSDLASIERRLLATQPDEAAVQSIAEQVRDQISASVDQAVANQVSILKETFELPAPQKQKIESIVEQVRAWIGCETYKDRKGQALDCAFRWLPPEVDFDKQGGYRVLFLGQGSGVYRPVLYSAPFYKSLETYLRETGGSPEFVQTSLRQIQDGLRKLDEISAARSKSAVEAFQFQLDQNRLKLQLDNRNLWRQAFPEQERAQVIEGLFMVQLALQSYSRTGIGSTIERDVLSGLLSRYEALVQRAAAISYSITLPEPIRVVQLLDDARTRFELKEPFPVIPAGRLLGRTDSEAQAWVKLLQVR